MGNIFYQSASASSKNFSMALYFLLQLSISSWQFNFWNVSLCTSIADSLSLDTATNIWVSAVAPHEGFFALPYPVPLEPKE